MEKLRYPPDTQSSIARRRLDTLGESDVQGDGACVGTAGEILLLSQPMTEWSVETSSGNSKHDKPTYHSFQATFSSSRDPSVSESPFLPLDNHVLESTADGSVILATQSSSAVSNRSVYRPANASKPSPSFLPTPPPEPYTALPQCSIRGSDFPDFKRSNVFPYGVQTPGLIHSPEDDYFGK